MCYISCSDSYNSPISLHWAGWSISWQTTGEQKPGRIQPYPIWTLIIGGKSHSLKAGGKTPQEKSLSFPARRARRRWARGRARPTGSYRSGSPRSQDSRGRCNEAFMGLPTCFNGANTVLNSKSVFTPPHTQTHTHTPTHIWPGDNICTLKKQKIFYQCEHFYTPLHLPYIFFVSQAFHEHVVCFCHCANVWQHEYTHTSSELVSYESACNSLSLAAGENYYSISCKCPTSHSGVCLF